MSTYDLVAELPVEIESYGLEGLQRDVSSEFSRRTTIVSLHGRGETGVGEDVTYDADQHEVLQRAGPVHDLSGEHTIESFSRLVGSLGLPNYRRWGFESAALDLALRQAGRTLSELLDRSPQPVRFVVSMRLGPEDGSARVLHLLADYPRTRFKLDPTSDWTDALVAELAELGAVDTLDLKGAYKGTIVDQPADAKLYRRVAEAFPDAWIEDPDLSSEAARAALEPHYDRVTWDAVIHSVADIERLPFPPRGMNIKPSRFGSIRALFEAYDYCDERGIVMYGGGQFELGQGRGQIQYLASLFHPGSPNDVAPSGYNDPRPVPGLPTSPLAPSPSKAGFRWGANGCSV